MKAKSETSGAETKFGPVYLMFEGEFLLNAPTQQAWAHVIDYPSWQNYTLVEHVSGPRGGEGEVVRLIKEEAGFSFPPFCARTVKLEPDSRVIWKVYFDKRPVEYRDFFGLAEFKISATEDLSKTRFAYRLFYEFVIQFQRDAELEKFRSDQEQGLNAEFASIWAKLRDVVEKPKNRDGGR
jgi:hypothetical protein